MISILFICTGNICRSPTAEAVFRNFVKDRGLDKRFMCGSAGTHGYHVGELPDARSIYTAERHGIDMGGLFASKLEKSDFYRFNIIIGMDNGHVDFALKMKPKNSKADVQLLLDFHPDYMGQDVPDPYYGTIKDFEKTYFLIEKGIESLLFNIL